VAVLLITVALLGPPEASDLQKQVVDCNYIYKFVQVPLI